MSSERREWLATSGKVLRDGMRVDWYEVPPPKVRRWGRGRSRAAARRRRVRAAEVNYAAIWRVVSVDPVTRTVTVGRAWRQG
jgi:hypothetical protein